MNKILGIIIFIFSSHNSHGQIKPKISAFYKFNLSTTDCLYTRYFVRHNKEGSSVIELYSDASFAFHSFSVIGKSGKFSAGEWVIKNDSTIILKSHDSIWLNIFYRTQRSAKIDRYKFVPIFFEGKITDSIIIIPKTQFFGIPKKRNEY